MTLLVSGGGPSARPRLGGCRVVAAVPLAVGAAWACGPSGQAAPLSLWAVSRLLLLLAAPFAVSVGRLSGGLLCWGGVQLRPRWVGGVNGVRIFATIAAVASTFSGARRANARRPVLARPWTQSGLHLLTPPALHSQSS